MSKTIKYVGTQDRWPELPITGQQKVWHRGSIEERSDQDAVDLLKTRLFSEIYAETPLGLPTSASIRAFEQQLSRAGVVANGVAKDGAALQDAILAASGASYKVLAMPPGLEIQVDIPLVYDISRVCLDGGGGSLRFDLLTNSAPSTPVHGVTLTRSQAFNDMRSSWQPLRNIHLIRRDAQENAQRDDSYNQNICGILLAAAGEPGIARCSFPFVHLEGFRDAVYFGPNSYIITWLEPRIIRNYTGFASRSVTAGDFANQGESILVQGGLLSANYEGWDVEQIYVHFKGTRMDYPGAPTAAIPDINNRRQRMGTTRKGAHVTIESPNFEFNDNSPLSNDTAMLYLADNGSQLHLQRGAVIAVAKTHAGAALSNGADGYLSYAQLRSLVECSNSPRSLIMEDCESRGLGLFKDRRLARLASGNAPRNLRARFINIEDSNDAGGKGRTSHPPVFADAAAAGGRNFGKLRRPTFDTGPATLEDFWYLCGSGGGTMSGQTNRYTATNGNIYVNGLTVAGGASPVGAPGELALRKTAAGGTQCRARLLCTVDQFTKIGLMFGLRASASASITASLFFCTVQWPVGSSYANPTTYNGKQIASSTTLVLTTGVQTFNLFNLTAQNTAWDIGDRDVPPWATHVCLELVTDAIDGSGTPFDLFVTNATVACD